MVDRHAAAVAVATHAAGEDTEFVEIKIVGVAVVSPASAGVPASCETEPRLRRQRAWGPQAIDNRQRVVVMRTS